MKNFAILVLSILLIAPLQAQKLDISQLKEMKIRNIGPAGMSGRITAIDVDLSNPDLIYVGAASGGVWKSINGGMTWNPIFDDQPAQSIGAIKINQANPSEIWVGTGEGNPRNSHNSGAGVYRSIDAGKSWTYMGLKETKLIHRIIVHKDNPNTIYVGAMGSAWGDSSHRGVYKSTDSGKNWKKILYVDQRTGIAELIADPNNPNKMFAAMWDFRRTPWDFTSGGKGSGLYVTHDGGDNWKRFTDEDGLPKGDLGRIGLAISAANSNVVYALVEAKENALYKSFDGGATWKKHSTHANIGNRPFYYYELHADPNNENIVYSIYTYVSKSTDGGKTFSVIADYGNNVHPDHHAFWISPDDSSYVIDGNDGGMNISYDAGETWRFVSNLPVGQFYHVSVDNDFPYNVYGGMQDNGTWVGPSFVLKSGGITNYDWQEVFFGDGFDVAPLPQDNRYGYAMSQGGNIGRYDRETGRTEFVKPYHPDGEKLRYNWNAALALQPGSDCGLYYGSQFVHYSNDCGVSWNIISPDLTTNDTTKQKQMYSGGLTYDATGAENNTTILAIAPSPVDKDVIWVGTDDGNLQLTTDGGTNWVNLSSRLPSAPRFGFIVQIEVSQKNAGEAFVVMNNYRMNDWSAYAYHTTNHGQTWKRIANDAQIKGFVTSIVQDPEEENLLFLGTDVGLYVSIDKGVTWNHWTEGFPQVQIRDMKIQTTMNDLVLGTFGRAFWVMDDITPLRQIAKEGKQILKSPFGVFDPSDAYITSRRSYDGIRFRAQAEFSGANKPMGARFRIWNNIEEKKEAKKDKKDDKAKMEDKAKKDVKPKFDKKLHVAILNESRDTIRQFSRELKEKGIQNVTWRLTQNGVRFPSKNDPKKDADPPGGVPIMPGVYEAIFSYKGHKDSTKVKVNYDPRVIVSKNEIAAKKKAIEDFNDIIEKSATAFDQLKEAKKSIDLVGKMMVNLPDTLQTELKDLHKEHNKQIKDLQEAYMEMDKVKGIQRDPSTLNSLMGGARRYLYSSWGMPGANSMNAVKHAKAQASEAIKNINAYIEGDWTEYQKKIKTIEFNPFKELKKVGLQE